MIFSIKANKDRSREKNVLPLKLNERNKNIIGMGNYYENSKFQLSDVDDYCPDYLCEIPSMLLFKIIHFICVFRTQAQKNRIF